MFDKILEVAYHVESDNVPELGVTLKVKSLDKPYETYYIMPYSVVKLHDNVYAVRC